MRGRLLCAAALGCLIGGAFVVGAGTKTGDADKGKAVFEENCTVCHNADSTDKKIGPGLKGLFKRETLHNGKKVTEENVRAMINAGGNGMPSYAEMLSEQEKTNVIAYLKTL